MNQKYKSLLLSIIFLVISIFCFAQYCQAETTISAHIYPYGLGYDTGYGARIEHLQMIGPVGLVGSAAISNQHKMDADFGHTYHYGGQVRYYYNGWYIGPGISFFGYKTEFADGTIWQKDSHQFYGVVGKTFPGTIGNKFDGCGLMVWYQPPESQTANKVELIRFRASFQIVKRVKAIMDVDVIRFDQSGERQTEICNTFGIGFCF